MTHGFRTPTFYLNSSTALERGIMAIAVKNDGKQKPEINYSGGIYSHRPNATP